MVRPKNLWLHQEVMLLALEDKKGTALWSAHYPQALGGALLAQLILSDRVAIDREKKKTFARVVDARPLGDELLDEALGRIAEAKRRQQLRPWVQRFSNLKRVKDRTAQQLCRLGILREAEDRVLLLFRRRVYPETDPRPEREIRDRLRRAIGSTGSAEPRTLVLLALAYHTGLLSGVLPKGELRRRKKDIQKAIESLPVGKATKEAVEAAQAAVLVATMVPVMAASAASH